ncbi:hypothetical protein ACFLXB_00010 [Chloroflexota bacterium]
MKFNTRELATIAVFGTLWGISEITMGSVLNALNVPFSGAVLGAIGLLIALIGRVFIPKRGSILFFGLIAMLLKLFNLGGIVIGPMVGILSEAILAELVLTLSKKPRLFHFMLAGSIGVTWNLVQPFVTGPLLFGRTLFIVWLDLLDSGSRILGLDNSAITLIAGVLILIYIVIGSAAGWLAWMIAKQLQIRMGRNQEEISEQ